MSCARIKRMVLKFNKLETFRLAGTKPSNALKRIGVIRTDNKVALRAIKKVSVRNCTVSFAFELPRVFRTPTSFARSVDLAVERLIKLITPNNSRKIARIIKFLNVSGLVEL